MKICLSFLLVLLTCTSYGSMTLSGNPSLKFTGYKFTEKVGVSGKFTKITWDTKKTGSNFQELLTGAKVKIDTYSIDAGKTARNINIRNGLFKNLGARFIEGTVKSVDLRSKKVWVDMKIGKKTVEVPFSYMITDKEIKLTSKIDIIKLGFAMAFEKLSKLCAIHHKGKDKKTKTWSEVDLEIIAKLK